MEVRRGASARCADKSDHVISADRLSNLDIEAGKMAISSRQAVSVIQNDQVSIGGLSLRIDDDPVCRSVHKASVESGNVEAKMHFGVAVERIEPVSIMTRDHTPYRPDGWRKAQNRRSPHGDLLQQFQLALQFGGATLQELDIQVGIRTTDQV